MLGNQPDDGPTTVRGEALAAKEVPVGGVPAAQHPLAGGAVLVPAVGVEGWPATPAVVDREKGARI